MSRSIETFISGIEAAAGLLGQAAAWPFRVAATRRAMAALGALNDRELADIGLVRQDLRDVSALALNEDPTAILAERADQRRRRRLPACPQDPAGARIKPSGAERLTGLLLAPMCLPASRPDGRRLTGGGKSGLHGDTAPDNLRRGRPQGQRHRKQTAG